MPTPAPAIPAQLVTTSSPASSTASRACPPLADSAGPNRTGYRPRRVLMRSVAPSTVQDSIAPPARRRFMASHSTGPRAWQVSRISATPARSVDHHQVPFGEERAETRPDLVGSERYHDTAEIIVNRNVGSIPYNPSPATDRGVRAEGDNENMPISGPSRQGLAAMPMVLAPER